MKNLLEEYPYVTPLIRGWFTKKLVQSLTDESISKEFKAYIEEKGVSDEHIANIIRDNPRALFDVFDENQIYIQILLHTNKTFTYNINNGAAINSFTTRIEAEKEAIEKAFEILNNNNVPVINE